MKTLPICIATLMLCAASVAQISDPILQSAQMPTYPAVALLTVKEGDVKLSFVLDQNGNVASVDILSGDPSLRAAAETVVRSWRFKLPAGLFRTEWRYETTFEYRFSGRELESGQIATLVVTVDSFHHLKVVSDQVKPGADSHIQVIVSPHVTPTIQKR